METEASERLVTSPSRFTRQNGPPYPLHTKKGGVHSRTTSHTGEKSCSCPKANLILPSSIPRPIQLFIIIPNQEHVNMPSSSTTTLSTAHFEKPTVAHLLKKFFALYSTRRFPTILWVRWIQSTSSRLPSLRYKRVGRVLSYFSYLIKK